MVNQEFYGTHSSGQELYLITLEIPGLAEIKCFNFGGIIVSWKVPDRHGIMEDVVLGFDELEQYFKNEPFFGAIIGRYANRIALGRFSLNGREYQLAQNNGTNHLHGGPGGFGRVIWNCETWQENGKSGVTFQYHSPDGEEGFPGNVICRVSYILSSDSSLTVSYEAETDKDTILNLTQHSYFNLGGDQTKGVENHSFTINADYFTPTNENLIPTGEILPVAGTPLDLRTPTPLNRNIDRDYAQLRFGHGFDHNFVLNQSNDPAATAYDPISGRFLEIFTTEPGMQFYSGNFLDQSPIGKNGIQYQPQSGFCFESQHFPDTPNNPDFPSVVITPDQPYHSQTIFKFTTQ